MIAFIAAAGTLAALTLSFIMPPLWRGAGGRPFAVAVGLGLVSSSVLLYSGLGHPAGLVARPQDPALVSARDAQAMVNRLSLHMQADPGNAKGWLLLARGQTLLKHYPEAEAAYRRLLAIGPDDPAALVAYAELLALSQDMRFQGAPAELLERALVADPRHARALYLSGGARFERADFTGAIARWTVLAEVAGEEEQLHQLALANIAEAQRQRDAVGTN
jgi:cytochrome c-type biogenesis protein CcmH